MDNNLTASKPPSTNRTSPKPIFLLAYPKTLQDPTCYMHSSATNHVTSSLGNLYFQHEYFWNLDHKLVVCKFKIIFYSIK